MKAMLAILASTGSVLAGGGHGGGGGGGYPTSYPGTSDIYLTTTATTYETVTTCPITYTHTKGGSTYEETTWTTSLVTVTDCGGDCGGEVTVTAPDTTVGTTTEVEVTYTTICPTTETVTAPGETYTTTYETTSVYITKVETVIYETVTAPAVTHTEASEVYTTITSLCPVTETKTLEGSTVVVTWTSTSTIKTVLPTTAWEYTSYTVTEYTSTEVYETETCPVTTYTTVSEGSTIYMTETSTEHLTLTKEYTLTETIPVTKTSVVDVTLTTEISAGETETAYPTVWITYSDTTIVTHSKPPSTVNYPTTKSVETTSTYVAPTYGTSSTAPVQVPSGLAPQATQAIGAVLAGMVGFAAML